MNTEHLSWFKSSYSDAEGGQCVELAFDWRKSSYSGPEGGQCVEVATHPTTVHLRDSKVPHGPQLAVAPATWTSFVSFARA